MGKKKEFIDNNVNPTDIGNWWQDPSNDAPPGGILSSEWRKQHPDAIYIRPDGFYKWDKDKEYVKIDIATDDDVQE